ncbi:hypothetical protein FGO68_gene15298 [Halteria grandinella]|uniref:Uncharacterized protein n=1 Tax=Halteria grandinella TaxID=5974 RepID=A0A8J8NU42_HALGN|nr:hypothetical protein FGO68_gene15298 [Halteria grandinella]
MTVLKIQRFGIEHIFRVIANQQFWDNLHGLGFMTSKEIAQAKSLIYERQNEASFSSLPLKLVSLHDEMYRCLTHAEKASYQDQVRLLSSQSQQTSRVISHFPDKKSLEEHFTNALSFISLRCLQIISKYNLTMIKDAKCLKNFANKKLPLKPSYKTLPRLHKIVSTFSCHIFRNHQPVLTLLDNIERRHGLQTFYNEEEDAVEEVIKIGTHYRLFMLFCIDEFLEEVYFRPAQKPAQKPTHRPLQMLAQKSELPCAQEDTRVTISTTAREISTTDVPMKEELP